MSVGCLASATVFLLARGAVDFEFGQESLVWAPVVEPAVAVGKDRGPLKLFRDRQQGAAVLVRKGVMGFWRW